MTEMKTFTLEYGGQKIATRAYTRGEARADFKRRLGIPPEGRLPPGAIISVLRRENAVNT